VIDISINSKGVTGPACASQLPSSRTFAISLVSFLLLLALVLHTIKAASEQNYSSNDDSGAVNRDSSLPANAMVPSQRNSWFPIPGWLTGTWQASSETVLDAYDYSQGISTVTEPTAI
jgi:hypothetical protein